MKSFSLFLAFIAIVATISSCQLALGPYKEVTRTYPLTNFDKLDMGSAFRIEVREGNIFAIEVRGNETDVNDLIVDVRNGTFYAEYRGTSRKNRYDTYFTITMPTLRTVNLSGAAKANITGFTQLNDLDVVLSGASTVTTNVITNRIYSDLSGASTLTLTGEGNSLVSKLSGSSTLKASDFPVTQANVDLSGASRANIRVQDVLTVKASGASHVRYWGSPRVNSNLTGASTLVQEVGFDGGN